VDSGAIVLGFTGPIGSGCSFIARALSEQNTQLKYFKVSDVIRSHLKREGVSQPTIEQLQTKGNDLRKKHGGDYLVMKLLKPLLNDKKITSIIIDGIKNTEEVSYLRFFPNFYLFSVHSDKEIRRARSTGDGKVIKTEEDFNRIDRRDEQESEPYGQQVTECDHLSDIILLNNEPCYDYPEGKKRDLIGGIYKTYVQRVFDLRVNKLSPDFRPSTDEMAMTSAYIQSKKSSCLKRKVGAVIVEERGIGKYKMPFILSSGYNEVPAGTETCMDKYGGKCYRDFAQEQQAQKILRCPKCGGKFEIEATCHRCNKSFTKYQKTCDICHNEISPTSTHKDCDAEIFKEYLPGAKESPGKLLDICRALHAEEYALLNLVNNYRSSTENLVLYTTTQPCNLCANKIVASGIKKVVFAEPYFMESSASVLEKAGVTVSRFQGVKSYAYFKLYK
jgi:deoxycytidylate deaminase